MDITTDTSLLRPGTAKAIIAFLVAMYIAVFTVNGYRGFLLTRDMRGASLTYNAENASAARSIETALRALGVPPVAAEGGDSIILTSKRQTIEGGPSVSSYIQDVSEKKRHLAGAMLTASLIVAFLAFRIYAKEESFVPLTILSPVLIAVLSIPVIGSCPGCSTGGDWLAQAARIGLAILPFALAYAFWFNPARIGRCIVAGLLLIASVGQCALLLSDPKFCFFCLSLGAVIGASFASLVRSHGIPRATLRPLLPAALSLLGIFSLTAAASALGFVSPTPKQNVVQEELLAGHKISDYLDGYRKGRQRLVVVSIPGCHACAKAKADLEASGVSYMETRFCGTISSGGCFQTDAKMLAPLLLLVDNQGVVVHQQSGWVDSPEESRRLVRSLTPSD